MFFYTTPVIFCFNRQYTDYSQGTMYTPVSGAFYSPSAGGSSVSMWLNMVYTVPGNPWNFISALENPGIY